MLPVHLLIGATHFQTLSAIRRFLWLTQGELWLPSPDSPILADLHWLPVRHRINFKIATIAFKLLHFQKPSYLAAIVPRYVLTRSLRSSSLSISIPSRKTAMARSKFFSSVASDTWNKLPCHLSFIFALPAFRKRLKHHLFSSAFPSISSPSTDITLCDVITSTNVNHTRCTLQPS